MKNIKKLKFNKKSIEKSVKLLLMFIGICLLAISIGGCLNKPQRYIGEIITPGSEASITIIDHGSPDKDNGKDSKDIVGENTGETPGSYIENRIGNIPYYFIAIHNEPNNEPGGKKNIEESFQYLIEMIAKADEYNIKLTLMFSAQWAAYIAENPGRLAMLNEWKENGHEIACHHHGIYHDSWDGYTNYSMQEARQIRLEMGKQNEKYKGTLKDFIFELKKLNPDIESGCFSDEKNKDVIPDEIIYDTCLGFSDCSEWEETPGDTSLKRGINEYILSGTVNGIERKWLAHSRITNEKLLNGAIKTFEKLDSSVVYGAFAQSIKEQMPFFYAYLDYLHSLDPEGLNSKTLISVIEKQLIPDKTIPEESY